MRAGYDADDDDDGDDHAENGKCVDDGDDENEDGGVGDDGGAYDGGAGYTRQEATS